MHKISCSAPLPSPNVASFIYCSHRQGNLAVNKSGADPRKEESEKRAEAFWFWGEAKTNPDEISLKYSKYLAS